MPHIAGEEPAFCRWKETFNIQEYQTEISQLLVSTPHVRALHSQLVNMELNYSFVLQPRLNYTQVPARISYELFWQHYWFNTIRVKEVRLFSVLLLLQSTAWAL